MPIIVVGADTDLGERIVAALLLEAPEVRAFVSDPIAAVTLKASGAKVACGDVSDDSDLGAAGLNTYSAVLIAAAATDGRERAFAATVHEVYSRWANSLARAGTRRAVWVGDDRANISVLEKVVAEFAAVDTADRPPADVVAEVVGLEGASRIGGSGV